MMSDHSDILRPEQCSGVHVIFVDDQDRLADWAGHAAAVWLRDVCQIWSSDLLAADGAAR